MHTKKLHTMGSTHTGCCRNSKSSMIVWHFKHERQMRLIERAKGRCIMLVFILAVMFAIFLLCLPKFV